MPMKRLGKRKQSKVSLKNHRKHKPFSKKDFAKLYKEKITT